jgi:hypothetical protein
MLRAIYSLLVEVIYKKEPHAFNQKGEKKILMAFDATIGGLYPEIPSSSFDEQQQVLEDVAAGERSVDV